MGAAALGAGGGLGGVLAACGSSSPSSDSSGGGGRAIKIGFVSPQTGALAAFGEADTYCVKRWNEVVKDGITTADGVKHPVQIIVKDSQSDSNRAAQVAGDLILNNKVDILMAASSGDNTTPVADQAEANGVPSISTDTPWQAWFNWAGGRAAGPLQMDLPRVLGPRG